MSCLVKVGYGTWFCYGLIRVRGPNIIFPNDFIINLGFSPNDLSLGFSNSQLRAHLESDRSSQIPCPLVARWWNAGGPLVARWWTDVARIDIAYN